MLRRGFLMAGVLLVAASVATLASAQPGGGFGGGMGFMGGGMMGGGNASITSLLIMPAVQTELKLTDDQKTKVQDLQGTMRDKMMEAFNAGGGPPDFQSMSQEERQKAMADMRKKMQDVNKDLDAQAVKILTSEQVDRVKELQLQRDGATALTRDEVSKKLVLTDDQTAKIKKLQDSITNLPMPQFDPNTDFQAEMQKRRDAVTKTQKEMLDVLTAEQKTAWEKMQGKSFTFPARGGRRGGGGFGPGGGPGGGGN